MQKMDKKIRTAEGEDFGINLKISPRPDGSPKIPPPGGLPLLWDISGTGMDTTAFYLSLIHDIRIL